MADGYIQKFIKSIQLKLFSWMSIAGILILATSWILSKYTGIEPTMLTIVLLIFWLLIAAAVSYSLSKKITEPTAYIAQTIMHINPAEHLVGPPKLEDVSFGREIAENLSRLITNYATVVQASDQPASSNPPAAIFDQIPVSIIGVDEKNNISLANSRAKAVLKTDSLVGQPLGNSLVFYSEDEASPATWLEKIRESSLNDLKLWQKVEIKSSDQNSLGYFDVAGSFNKHSSSGTEVIFALYDHSDAYKDESDSISFVALAVHELRTPLTIMRGYIEAFREDLGQSTSPQIQQDLRRMNVSAESLASFVSNILNVARINQGQLSLHLKAGNWNRVLPQIIDNLRERAAVHDKEIELRMQPGLPEVAIDPMTIEEVITNLIDNAIKYSRSTERKILVVSQLNKDGLVETTVTDHGVGIPTSVIPNLFSKFYRNHRTRGQVGGTGLGLYLSKTIITAHQGSIWVSSKENEGSTFGFSLIPYEQLDKDPQTTNNEDIVHSRHGWIKNHSLQRR
jgi:two-component system, OmpR family, sensor histidine kinase VicK